MAVTTTINFPNFDKFESSQKEIEGNLVLTNKYLLGNTIVLLSVCYTKKLSDGTIAIYRVDSTDYTK